MLHLISWRQVIVQRQRLNMGLQHVNAVRKNSAQFIRDRQIRRSCVDSNLFEQFVALDEAEVPLMFTKETSEQLLIMRHGKNQRWHRWRRYQIARVVGGGIRSKHVTMRIQQEIQLSNSIP